MKRFLLLTALLLLAIASFGHDFEVDGIYYSFRTTTYPVSVSVTSPGTGSSKDVYKGAITIPSSVTYENKTYSVTAISSDAFFECKDLTSIAIPSSIYEMGNDAFNGCSGLSKVIVSNLAAWCRIDFPNVWSNPLYYAHHLYSDNNTEITNLVIPNSVTSIAPRAFCDCTGLTSVTFGSNVTSIGSAAFIRCTGLSTITIPNNVKTIGYDAFESCSGLTSLTMGSGLTTIGNEAFNGCSALASVTFGSNVTSIGDWSFNGCNGLTSITIPNSVTSIGYRAFARCSGLTSISVNANNSTYDSRGNCNAIIETATNTLITGCRTTVIPNTVTAISGSAFEKCSGLTTIEIPQSVTTIGSLAFDYCSDLNKVIVRDLASWCNISFEDSFSNPLYYAHHLYSNESTEITDLVIPNGVTSIGANAFYGGSSITSITIPKSVTSIGENAFSYCSSITNVTIPQNVTSIGTNPFRACTALTSIAVNAKNTTYDSRENCNAIIEKASNTLIVGCKNSVIPSGVTAIGDNAFHGCSVLRNIEIPNGVTTIGARAFYNCRLTSVIIPEGVTSIGSFAFGVNRLASVTIPKSVTKIEGQAFLSCPVRYLTVGHETPLTLYSTSFPSLNNTTVYVPVGSKQAYENTGYWKWVKEIIEIDGSVSLLDNEDNTQQLDDHVNEKCNVTLTRRTLNKDGMWNTLCLPFDYSAEQFASSGLDDATLMALDNADYSNGMLTLNFVPATSIEAGKAYIIKWDAATYNLVNPTFYAVTVKNTTADTEKGVATFKGAFSPVPFEANDKTKLYLASDNKLCYPAGNVVLGSCRAYFQLNGISAGELPQGARIVTSSGEEIITSIGFQPTISPREEGDGCCYSLDGRKVSDGKSAHRQLPKGIYIQNGKKFVVK